MDLKRGVDYIGITCVFFCHDGKGNLLLSKRSKNCRDEIGRWDVGGGSMEFGEDFEEAARREIKEEYCTDVLDMKFVKHQNVIRQEEGSPRTHWICFLFLAHVNPKKVKNGDPLKIDDIGWFHPTKLPNPMHSMFDKSFKIIKESGLMPE